MATQTHAGAAGQAAALSAVALATTPERNPLAPLNAGSALDLLYVAAEGHLSVHELERLADVFDIAEAMARQAATTADSIAFLVDADADSKAGAGNFQSGSDVPDLLHLLSHTFSTISGLVNVGSQAALKLGEMRKGMQS